jgi:hypothetical protein
MSAYLGTVRADNRRRLVVWTMTAAEARDLADSLTEGLEPGDLAFRDSRALLDAANEVDPPRDEQP